MPADEPGSVAQTAIALRLGAAAIGWAMGAVALLFGRRPHPRR